MNTSRPLAALLVGMLGASLLTGCMATPKSGESSGAGTRLRVALNFTPRADLSPYTDDAVSLTRIGVTESLISIDPNGAPQPALAEKFEMSDDKTAKFTLRPNVTFHDGTKLDAKTVVASLQNALKATPAPPTVSGLNLTITAEGDKTVLVTSEKADPLLIMRFGNPDMAILAPKAYEKDANKPSAVGTGTGPFKLVSLNGTSAATLDANTSYWQGKPKLSGLDVKFISKADSRVSALRAGELDVIQNVPIAQMKNLDGFVVDTRPIPRTTGISLNTKSGPFTDAGLRATVAKSLDKQTIVKSVFEGHADVANGYFRSDTDWAKNRPAPQYPEAKSANGVKITVATYSDRPELPEALTIIAEQLRKAGFTVDTPVVKNYSVLEPELKEGKYDLVLGSRMYMSKANDPLSVLQSDFGCKGGYNLAFFCDSTIDAEIAAALPISDITKRREAAVAIEAKILGAGAYVPVLHEQIRLGRVKQVSGLFADPLEWKWITHETTITK